MSEETNKQAPANIGPIQRQVLNVIANFEADGATACFQLPRERAAVRRLAERDIVEIVRVGKFAGMNELFVTRN